MAKQAEKKEKPFPKKCICGREAIIVINRGKKMVPCPDPLNCTGNHRTMWHGHTESAISEWNGLIDSLRFQSLRKTDELTQEA